ncbi:hypothetical protein DV736_g5643, partial [Chaetothyriales sp. CBS 134916]
MCDTVFAIGPDGGYHFESPSARRHDNLPSQIQALFSQSKIAAVYCLALGAGDSFYISYKDKTDGRNRCLCNNLSTTLQDFLLQENSKGYADLELRTMQWLNLPNGFDKQLDELRIPGGSCTVKPRFITLGVNNNYIMVNERNGGSYSELDSVVDVLRVGKTHAWSLIQSIHLSPHQAGCAVLQGKNGHTMGFGLPDDAAGSFNSIVETIKSDTETQSLVQTQRAVEENPCPGYSAPKIWIFDPHKEGPQRRTMALDNNKPQRQLLRQLSSSPFANCEDSRSFQFYFEVSEPNLSKFFVTQMSVLFDDQQEVKNAILETDRFWKVHFPRLVCSLPIIQHCAMFMTTCHESVAKATYTLRRDPECISKYTGALQQLRKDYNNVSVDCILLASLLLAMGELAYGPSKSGLSHLYNACRIIEQRQRNPSAFDGHKQKEEIEGMQKTVNLMFKAYFRKLTRESFLPPPTDERDNRVTCMPQLGSGLPFSTLQQATGSLEEIKQAARRLFKERNSGADPQDSVALQSLASTWMNRFEAFLAKPESNESLRIACLVVHMHGCTTLIETKLPSQESDFDSHIPIFTTIAEAAEEFLERTDGRLPDAATEHLSYGIGPVNPLFYATTKCRHFAVRRRLLRVLRLLRVSEGPWTSCTAFQIASHLAGLEAPLRRSPRKKPTSRYIIKEAHCDDDINGDSGRDDEDESDTDLSGFIVDDDAELSYYESAASELEDDGDADRSRKVANVEIIDLTSSPHSRSPTRNRDLSDPFGVDSASNLVSELEQKLRLSPPELSQIVTRLDNWDSKSDDKAELHDSGKKDDGCKTRPETPRRFPTKLKSPSKLLSPSKGNTERRAPYRQSTDAFWDLSTINQWNDINSPKKTLRALPGKNRHAQFNIWSDESGDDETRCISNNSLPSPLDSPTKPKYPCKGPVKAETRRMAKAKKTEKLRKAGFDAAKRGMAQDLFDELDANITDGRIAKLSASTGGVKIEWSKTLRSTAGRANWRRSVTKDSGSPIKGSFNEEVPGIKVEHFASIELAEKVIDCEERLVNTLAHEYCHLANFMVSNICDQPHGASFKMWAAKVTQRLRKSENELWKNVEVTTKHGYTISHKYLWVCVGRKKTKAMEFLNIEDSEGCGAEYGRHRKAGPSATKAEADDADEERQRME